MTENNRFRKTCFYCGTTFKIEDNYCSECGKALELVESKEQCAEVASETNSLNISEEQVNTSDEVSTEYCPDYGYETSLSVYQYRKDDYAYFQLKAKKENEYHFMCINDTCRYKGTISYINKFLGRETDLEVGDYVWLYLEKCTDINKRYFTAKVCGNNNQYINKRKEYQSFVEHRKEKSFFYAPVEKVNMKEKYLEIGIGPSATRYVYNAKDMNTIPFKDIQEGKVYRFYYEGYSIEKESSNIILNIQYVDDMPVLWSKLPVSINQMVILPTLFEVSRSSSSFVETIEKATSNSFSYTSFKEYIDIKYQKALEERRISFRIKDNCIFGDFYSGFVDENGVPWSIGIKRKVHDKWAVNLIGYADSYAERLFEKNVYFSDINTIITSLNDKVLSGENWKASSDDTENTVLRIYFLFSYYKSKIDNQVKSTDDFAIFNTGLVDKTYNDIYCYLIRNRNTCDFYQRKWEFGGFICRGEAGQGKQLHSLFKEFPSAPVYVNSENIVNSFYDGSDLVCNIDHIIIENVNRLPECFIQQRLSIFEEFKELIDPTSFNKNKGEIYKIIKADDEIGHKCQRELKAGFEASVEVAKKWCTWNYRTAIPIYYARKNSISIGLPLRLGSDKVNSVLVVERLGNGNYQGQTIYSVEMAYQDARQICRPESEWLSNR